MTVLNKRRWHHLFGLVVLVSACGGATKKTTEPIHSPDPTSDWDYSDSPAVALFEEARGEKMESTERWRLEQNEEGINTLASEVQQVCGTAIPLKVDYKSFHKMDAQQYGLSGYCGAPASVLVEWCEGPRAKKYIAKHIREIRCQHQDSGDMSLEIEDGIVMWRVNFTDSRNHATVVKKALFNKL